MVICKNCGAQFDGKYCNHCGQKHYGDKEKSIKQIFEEAFHFLTHFEGKFFTTLKTVLFKPGKLSNDFSSGIRIRYYKPASFYLFIVILYLLFPVFPGLNMELKYYQTSPLTGPLMEHQIQKKLASRNVTFEKFSEEFHHQSEKTSKLLLFLLIPFTVPIIRLFFMKCKRWLYDDFVLAIEINIFYLLVFFLIFPFAYISIVRLLNVSSSDNITGFVILGLFIIYLTLLFRKVFKQRLWVSIIKAFFFGVLHAIMLQLVYKFIAFEVTMAML